LKVNSASCCFLVYGYITMHRPQRIKFLYQLDSVGSHLLNNDACRLSMLQVSVIVNPLP